MYIRRSGILLHITSLPSAHGVGDLGPAAYQFADFLAECGQSFWQILPVNPTSPAYGNSPYNSHSAFAGSPLMISLEMLVREGLLHESDLEITPRFPQHEVDYPEVIDFKFRLLHQAFENHKHALNQDGEFQKFCQGNAFWLEDYSLFIALREHFNGALWGDWPWEIRTRQTPALDDCRAKLHDRILKEKFIQHHFFQQWELLKNYCSRNNLHLIGDIPIYVNYDSADVWANHELFKLNGERKPTLVSGVPPDFFSATGQLWGSPVYQWETLKRTRYAWWLQRFDQNFKLCDLVRLDHFRGFIAYWEIPAHESTAMNGRWVEAPVLDFLTTLVKHYPYLPIIAEDLGVITPDVREMMQRFDFPGMKLLLCGFNGDMATDPNLPHHYPKHCVVYTGTHDNNTAVGWFRKEASTEDRHRLFQYLGREVDESNVHWELIRLLMRSAANMVVIPMQDVLGLNEEARMNLPATGHGNWKWRLAGQQLTPEVKARLAEMTRIYGRS
jgi:4-alpha-glucanotransferase